jgi:hypothetical protein
MLPRTYSGISSQGGNFIHTLGWSEELGRSETFVILWCEKPIEGVERRK